jgi:hypothetical protein
MPERNKIVVFDLDETLGYFTQLCIIWESIEQYIHENNVDTRKMGQDDFNKLLELFPEYVRPNIETILDYLKQKKMTKKCKNVMIYTNNQRQKNWVFLIKKYFETKLKYNLFDQIISAFKINGRQVELCRTTHNKTHKDFIKCSKIPQHTQICFIDDTYYPEMHKDDDVYYIKIKPYTYSLGEDTIIDRLKKSTFFDKWFRSDINIERECLLQFLKDHLHNLQYKSKSMNEYDIDKIITKQIMNHIELFFYGQQKYPPVTFNNIHKTKKRRAYKNITKKVRQ